MSYRFAEWSCSQAVSKPVWHIPLLRVQWKTPDDGQRNCPKHVDFYSKNNFTYSNGICHTCLLYVQWKTPDDGQRNCLKHVEFYFKNKFEKLVHLVGFIIRIYHDARSSERQMQSLYSIGDVWRKYIATVQSYWKGNPKYSERNLSQCHFVHHIPHIKWAGIEPGPLR